jgi:hypothetical protein
VSSDPAPIRGRWTIWFCPACAGSNKQSLGCPHDEDEFAGEPLAVEVVPVPDEAAIERGAKAVRDTWRLYASGSTPKQRQRAVALAVLRAALETPDGQ